LDFSLVIPAYNEAARIGPTLDRAIAYLGAQPYASEIVVVVDGGQDDTPAVARSRDSRAVPVRVVELPENRGKGYAVREGMLREATGAVRLFFDADGSTPIEELEKVWPKLAEGAAVVIGSRAHPDSDIAVRQSPFRERLGRINNALLQTVGLTNFPDTQCGFKAFTAAACEIVFPRQTIDGFSFDVELLCIAGQHGLSIAEIPVRWENSPDSRVHPVRDSARMFRDLLRIRWRSLRGVYR